MVAVAVAIVLAGCASGSGQTADGSASDAPSEGAEAPDEERITGTLGGDAQLEGGCGWVDDGTTRWNVQYPQGYTLAFEPLTLTGPDGQTAEEGDTVTVAGSEQRDVMTLCQVGPVWAATSVEFGE